MRKLRGVAAGVFTGVYVAGMTVLVVIAAVFMLLIAYGTIRLVV